MACLDYVAVVTKSFRVAQNTILLRPQTLEWLIGCDFYYQRSRATKTDMKGGTGLKKFKEKECPLKKNQPNKTCGFDLHGVISEETDQQKPEENVVIFSILATWQWRCSWWRRPVFTKYYPRTTPWQNGVCFCFYSPRFTDWLPLFFFFILHINDCVRICAASLPHPESDVTRDTRPLPLINMRPRDVWWGGDWL